MTLHPELRYLLPVAVLLVACDRKPADLPAPPATAVAGADMTAPVPDVGHLVTVKVSADGHGVSASDAVAEALRLAILQVNGASIDMVSIDTKFGLDVTLNQSAEAMRAEGFRSAVRQRSGGVVQNFRIVAMEAPASARGKYKATIEANIAQFSAPAELKKIKLAVAPLRFDRPSIALGDRSLPSSQVGAELRQRIVDALVNTGRFAVLDRDFSPELQQELDMIANGEAPRAEAAKLSQAATADVLWIGKINALSYDRHARQLRSSDRELVSYSGGWSVSQKLVNVATRQIMASDTLTGSAPSTAPTTLATGVDSRRILDGMTSGLVNGVVASILARTFPITVVALEGANVVLSQGGQALHAGARYAMVTMGPEMKDPQTGQSLGRVEAPCCELTIDRVTPNLSYGHIENAAVELQNLQPGALQVREALQGVAVRGVSTAVAKTTAPVPARSAKARAPKDQDEAEAPADKNADKW